MSGVYFEDAGMWSKFIAPTLDGVTQYWPR